MDLGEAIRRFLERGGIIKKVPLGFSALEGQPVPMFWVENDNVIRVNFR